MASRRQRRRTRALVRRARRGNASAFATLWDDHSSTLRGILMSMVHGQEAEDLMQDVALRAWKAIGALEDADRFSPWLCTIARNVGRNALAAKRRAAETIAISVDEAAEMAATGSTPNGPEGADEIMNCIRELPEAYREPLTLRLLLDLTGPEIAERTGLTPGSVRVNLCRGMKLLRGQLEGEGVMP